MTTEDLARELEDGAQAIDTDGTPSQIGPDAATLRAAAARLRELSDGWQTIDSAPMKRLIIGTDGSVVQPIRRLEPDVIYCPQPTSIDLWTHWRPFPQPPGDAG